MNITYPAKFKKDGNAITVQFIDFKDIYTYGDNVDHAKAMAAEVLTVMLEVKLEKNQNIPAPSNPKGKDVHYIAPDATVQAALLFRLNKDAHKLSDIARAMGTSWAAVQRLEDPKHAPNIKTLEKAAAALGKRLVLSFE
jgi:antitoxin HicB